MNDIEYTKLVDAIRHLSQNEVRIRQIVNGYIVVAPVADPAKSKDHKGTEEVCIPEDQLIQYLGKLLQRFVNPDQQEKTFIVVNLLNNGKKEVVKLPEGVKLGENSIEEKTENFVNFMCQHDTIMCFVKEDLKRGYKYKGKYWFFGDVAIWVGRFIPSLTKKETPTTKMLYICVELNDYIGKRIAALGITILSLNENILKQYQAELKTYLTSVKKSIATIEQAEQKARERNENSNTGSKPKPKTK